MLKINYVFKIAYLVIQANIYILRNMNIALPIDTLLKHKSEIGIYSLKYFFILGDIHSLSHLIFFIILYI